ncbi:hypothetical protein [Candidatus Uabimicrobium sp. HlEnr_7]|uniref:hypothetical protein n=1 Tax=Candidatus Uabimicrobium helgolandensis TaxID=3095367 RepID=UPI003558B60E
MRATTFIMLLVMIFTCNSYTYAKSDMRKDWIKEKKQARKAFKEAYEDFIEGLSKKEAKEQLEELGLKYGDKELEDYIKFDKDFGPAIDSLVTYHEIEIETPTVEEIIADEKMWEIARKVANGVHEEHSWLYYTRDHGIMSMKKIYDTYINGSTQINISSETRDRWNKASKANFDEEQYTAIAGDTLAKLRKKTYEEKYAWKSLLSQVTSSEEVEDYLKDIEAKKHNLDYKVVKKARKLALKRCNTYSQAVKDLLHTMRKGIKKEDDKKVKKELKKESKKLKKELNDLLEVLRSFAKKIKKKY